MIESTSNKFIGMSETKDGDGVRLVIAQHGTGESCTDAKMSIAFMTWEQLNEFQIIVDGLVEKGNTA